MYFFKKKTIKKISPRFDSYEKNVQGKNLENYLIFALFSDEMCHLIKIFFWKIKEKSHLI